MAYPLPVQPALSSREETAADRQRRIMFAIAAMRDPAASPMSLDELAETAYYSRFHFARSFREVTGSSPGVFQTALRFARASELLLTTDATVTEICGEVGYASLGTFSDRFRDLVGVSPVTYRELPHRVAALPAASLRQGVPSIRASGCRVRIFVPETMAGMHSAYIGLYPVGRASGVPIAGAMAGGPGIVTVSGFPPGRYHVLSAAFPVPIDGHGHLLPGPDVLVSATRRPVPLGPADNPLVRLAYRRFAPTDAPILTALPALVVEQVTGGLDLRPATR